MPGGEGHQREEEDFHIFHFFQVETTIPVQECKRQRFGQETIFLSRGQVIRKEGEKRRRKLFRRLTGGKDKKGRKVIYYKRGDVMPWFSEEKQFQLNFSSRFQ